MVFMEILRTKLKVLDASYGDGMGMFLLSLSLSAHICQYHLQYLAVMQLKKIYLSG